MTTVKRKSKQLGQILIELGYITQDQLEQALAEHQRTPKPLGRLLIEHGMIKEADLVRTLAEQVGLEFVDLATSGRPDGHVARARVARAPLPGDPDRGADGKLLVAMADPSNVFAVDDIRTITGREVQPSSPRRATSSGRSRSTPGSTARSTRSRTSPPTRSTTRTNSSRPRSRTRRSSSSST